MWLDLNFKNIVFFVCVDRGRGIYVGVGSLFCFFFWDRDYEDGGFDLVEELW